MMEEEEYIKYLNSQIERIQREYSPSTKMGRVISETTLNIIVPILAAYLIAYVASYVVGAYVASWAVWWYQRDIRDKVKANLKENGQEYTEALGNKIGDFLNKVYEIDDTTRRQIAEAENYTEQFGIAQNFIREQYKKYVTGSLLPDNQIKDFLTYYLKFLNQAQRTHIIPNLNVPIDFEIPFSGLNSFDQSGLFHEKVHLHCFPRTWDANDILYNLYTRFGPKTGDKLLELYLIIWLSELDHNVQVYLYFNFKFDQIFAGQRISKATRTRIERFFNPQHFVTRLFLKCEIK